MNRERQHPTYLPARFGRAFLERSASFSYSRETTESLLFQHPQAPQYHPRTQKLRPSKPFDPFDRPRFNIDQDPYTSIPLIQQRYQAPPMPAFQHAFGRYMDIDWNQHVGRCHDMLLHKLPRHGATSGEQISEGDMRSLLAIMTYGLGGSTHVLHHFTLDCSRSNDDSTASRLVTTPMPAFGHKRMALGAYSMGHMSSRLPHLMQVNIGPVQSAMEGCSLLVAPILVTGLEHRHWCMTIFDRNAGQLFIFDNVGYSSGEDMLDRDDRIEGIVHLWIQFWNMLHRPYHFSYFAPAVTAATVPRFSGWYAFQWALSCIRDEAGNMPRVRMDEGQVIYVGNHNPDTYSLPVPSRPLQDWLPQGTSIGSRDEADRQICRILGDLLMNELDLTDPTPGRLWQTRDSIRRSVARNKIMDARSYYSSFGGPQLSVDNAVSTRMTRMDQLQIQPPFRLHARLGWVNWLGDDHRYHQSLPGGNVMGWPSVAYSYLHPLRSQLERSVYSVISGRVLKQSPRCVCDSCGFDHPRTLGSLRAQSRGKGRIPKSKCLCQCGTWHLRGGTGLVPRPAKRPRKHPSKKFIAQEDDYF